MTTIDYDKVVVDFIAGLNATGHVTHVKYKKTSVTLHHNGGRLSLQGILDVWKTRKASAHFQSDSAGRLGQYVHVLEYAWATGTAIGNQKSISIEMANSTLAPTWQVAEATWKSAARLAGWLFANVIDGRPRPNAGNLHYHHFWKSTDCAGPYMDSIYPRVLNEVQYWYDFFTNPPLPVADDWEMIMSLYKTPAEFEAAVARAVTKGNADYWRAFFKDEAGTGDTILDDMRAHYATIEQQGADTLAELKNNTEVTRKTSANPSA